MYSMPVRTVWTFFTSPVNAVPGVHVAERRVLPAGHEHRQLLLHRGQQPRVFRVDLVLLLQHARGENLVHELVREIALARLVGAHPFLEHRGLDPAHRFHLGNAGVGHAIHVAVEQRLLVGGGEVAVIRHALVVIVRDEIEHVLLEIRAGATDGVHLVLPDHFRQREAEFRRAHRAGQVTNILPPLARCAS